MALLDLYERSIYSALNQPKFFNPTSATQPDNLIQENPMMVGVDNHYFQASKIRLGEGTNTFILPNDPARKDRYTGKVNYAITSAEKTANFLTSQKGLEFTLTQTLMQSFNPQIETKVYNPLSLFSNTIPLVGFHQRRHLSLSTTLFGLIDIGISAGDSYTEVLYASEPEMKSRAVYQSPVHKIPNQEAAGVDYANAGRDIMTLAETYYRANPNRYLYPIGADGGGLPLTNTLSPKEELQRNIGLAKHAARFTQATGMNRFLDGQITIMNNNAGNFFTDLLKNIPYASVILDMFGFGIPMIDMPEIKIYNKFNPTFLFNDSKKNRNTIKKLTDEGNVVTYSIRDGESPLNSMLDIIETVLASKATEKPAKGKGFTFTNDTGLIAAAPKLDTVGDFVDESPYDGRPLDRYLQTYGQLMSRRNNDRDGGANINLSLENAQPYSRQLEEDAKTYGFKTLYTSYGFARSGEKFKSDKDPDMINMLDYGEDYGEHTDIIPFRFFHINEQKPIIFRASLTGINENISAEWNSKKYIGRADKVYIYKGADRKLSFNFTVYPYSPQELAPLWRKLNYLVGLCYPKYKQLGDGRGEYMEAPFIKLTIGDLYVDVPGILDGLTFNIPDDTTWETRDTDPFLDDIDIAKLPRQVNVTVSGFTILGLDDRPMSSTSKFFSPDFIPFDPALGEGETKDSEAETTAENGG